MKTLLLFALATIVPCLCDESSTTFPKPLILDFYQKDKGSTIFRDITAYQDTSNRVDDGESSNANNPSYLNHFKFTSSDGPKRTFYWQVQRSESTKVSPIVGNHAEPVFDIM